MRGLIVIFMAVVLSGCMDSTRVKRDRVHEIFASENSSFYVSQPEDGAYGSKIYQHSGKMTASAIRSALLNHVQTVYVAGRHEGREMALSSARDKGADYLIYPTILHWEDRATEWNFLRDEIKIKIEMIDALSGQADDTAFIEGKSGIATLGGDHPQDLLHDPIEDYINNLFGRARK